MNIYQIEVTNHCNYSCGYCPRSKMTRSLGIMSTDTFIECINQAKGPYIRLHHFGESLIDIRLEKKIMESRQVNHTIKMILNTNGSLLTPQRVERLFNAGMHKIILSYHNDESLKYIYDIPKEYRSSIEIVMMSNEYVDLSYLCNLGYDTNIKRLRDLGQLKKEKILEGNPVDRCSFLRNNEVAILWDGTIVPCCECYDNTYKLGNIIKDDSVENKPFELCKTCLGYGNDEEETERW